MEVFKRVEKKYLLDEIQYNELIKLLSSKIEKDKYFKSDILNLYFDNNQNEMIIESLEKPLYKEKIRVRSYKKPNLEDYIFFEIKKKYKSVVSKRRVKIRLKDLYYYLETGDYKQINSQVMREIDYVIRKNNLTPKIFIAYKRESYFLKDDPYFRITFDYHLKSRTNNLRLEENSGELYFNEPMYIMELKTLDSIPFWFSEILSKLQIYPTSFSKYGNIYKKGLITC